MSKKDLRDTYLYSKMYYDKKQDKIKLTYIGKLPNGMLANDFKWFYMAIEYLVAFYPYATLIDVINEIKMRIRYNLILIPQKHFQILEDILKNNNINYFPAYNTISYNSIAQETFVFYKHPLLYNCWWDEYQYPFRLPVYFHKDIYPSWVWETIPERQYEYQNGLICNVKDTKGFWIRQNFNNETSTKNPDTNIGALG